MKTVHITSAGSEPVNVFRETLQGGEWVRDPLVTWDDVNADNQARGDAVRAAMEAEDEAAVAVAHAMPVRKPHPVEVGPGATLGGQVVEEGVRFVVEAA